MFILDNVTTKPYQFSYMNDIITCKNPDVAFWKKLTEAEGNLEMVDSILDYIIPVSKREAINGVDITAKAMLIKDYIKYHIDQLNSFRSSDTEE